MVIKDLLTYLLISELNDKMQVMVTQYI